MSEIEVIRRDRSHKTEKPLTMRIEVMGSRFGFNKRVANLLNVELGGGVMFAFNKKNKTAFICKDNEIDAFKLRRKNKTMFSFSSNDLFDHFDEVFQLLEKVEVSYCFNVSANPNDKGMHQLLLIEKK